MNRELSNVGLHYYYFFKTAGLVIFWIFFQIAQVININIKKLGVGLVIFWNFFPDCTGYQY